MALAREVALGMGSYDLVLASEVPRTLETAIAMGFAVDGQQAIPTDVASAAIAEIGHHDRWTWATPWVRFSEKIDEGGPGLHNWARGCGRRGLPRLSPFRMVGGYSLSRTVG